MHEKKDLRETLFYVARNMATS